MGRAGRVVFRWANRGLFNEQKLAAASRYNGILAGPLRFADPFAHSTRLSTPGVLVLAFWLNLPLIARLIALAVTGLVGGAIANHMIYTWAYFPRKISPWAKPSDDAAPRKASDRVPIFGWLGLRREVPIHGQGFWIRPILIEVGLAIALPLLYWYETQLGGLLPLANRPAGGGPFEPWGTQIFVAHALLVLLMTAATFIDFDEQTIPDLITVPGTILALVLGSCSVYWFMPAELTGAFFKPTLFHLPWPLPDPKWKTTTGLWTGLAIWSGWCFALADRRLILRKGLGKAIQFFFAGLVRYPTWKLLVAIWVGGLVGITIVFKIGGNHWYGLFTSLVGLAVGGGIVWVIRLTASWAMRVEAMGFGDVTLMAMIGAFVGWQAATIGFMMAPFAAIVIVIIQYLVTREPRVPFGPYLCAGTMICIVFWDRLYNSWFAIQIPMFAKVGGWMLIAIIGLMIGMLSVWRIIKEAVFQR